MITSAMCGIDLSIEPVLHELSRWWSSASLDDRAQLRLVCHQPDRARLAYLHSLYPGLDDRGLTDIGDLLARELPPGLVAFYRVTNGARLFEGSVCIGGFVDILSRDPNNHQPISIGQFNAAFPALHPEWSNQGYFALGGISILRQDKLICGPNDHVVLLNGESGEPQREFSNVQECLALLSMEMSAFWTKVGEFVGDWKLIDAMITQRPGRV